VFKTDPSGVHLPITPEGGYDEMWKQVMEKRREDHVAMIATSSHEVFRNPTISGEASPSHFLFLYDV
jgi:hypothetical protein